MPRKLICNASLMNFFRRLQKLYMHTFETFAEGSLTSQIRKSQSKMVVISYQVGIVRVLFTYLFLDMKKIISCLFACVFAFTLTVRAESF